MFSIAFGLALLLHPAASPANCVLDPARLVAWEDWASADQPEQPNFKTVYTGCGKSLTFVAVEHSNDPASATYTLIENALKTDQPDIVILEGFPSAFGKSPQEMVEFAKSVEGTAGDFEPMFAIRLADEGDVPFIGGEPSDEEVLKASARLEISASDVFGFYVLRQIDQWVQSGEAENHTDTALNGLIARFGKEFSLATGVDQSELETVADFDRFKAWYAAQNGFDYDAGYRPEDTWPTSPDTNRTTNRLSDQISDLRDQHIQMTMAKALNEHDNVMIIYGFSHHLIHKPALESAFPKT